MMTPAGYSVGGAAAGAALAYGPRGTRRRAYRYGRPLSPTRGGKADIPVSTRRVIPDIAARLRDDLVGRREHNLLVTALELLQERGETFRDSLLDGTVLGPKPYPDCPQPWASGQDVTRFGLARPMLPVLAATDS